MPKARLLLAVTVAVASLVAVAQAQPQPKPQQPPQTVRCIKDSLVTTPARTGRTSSTIASTILYFAGGGFDIPDSIRTFHFPPSRTYVAVQKPDELTAAPF
jgi:hypothetical protein